MYSMILDTVKRCALCFIFCCCEFRCWPLYGYSLRFHGQLSILANSFRPLVACTVSHDDIENEDTNCFLLLQQERTRSYDSFGMHSLENSLIDIMRAEQDSLKGLFPQQQPGRIIFPHFHFSLNSSRMYFRTRRIGIVSVVIQILSFVSE